MAPAESKRLSGRKVSAVACFDSFGKLAMTMLASCRREGAETTLLLLELTTLPRLLLERGARLSNSRGLVRVDIPPVDAAVRFYGFPHRFFHPNSGHEARHGVVVVRTLGLRVHDGVPVVRLQFLRRRGAAPAGRRSRQPALRA